MKTRKILIFGVILVIFLLTFLSFVNAQEEKREEIKALVIQKTAPPEIRINEILKVKIEIWNYYNETLSIILKEIINFGEPLDKEYLVQEDVQNFTEKENETIINGIRWLNPDEKCEVGCREGDKICDPDCGCTFEDDSDCGVFVAPIFPEYRWEFVLEPNGRKAISYRVKPFSIGTIKISPTIAETKIGTFYSNSLMIRVKCNSDGICESYENYYNCKEDCESGREDGYCDKILDGTCDPDCKDGQDPDCSPAKCGDEICETEKGESYENCPQDCEKPVICGDNFCEKEENFLNCPQDCESGSKDNYCDGVKDGTCDLDCRRELDEDCFCNNDKRCEPKFENFGNCPEDCESGVEDGYCDKVKDGTCDPDCEKGQDQDCEKNYFVYLLFAIIGLIIAFIIIYKKNKTR